ncbi:DNA repair protein RadA [Paramaledivibacter caminithermalis]|uniref:DNA repair protein RadA n=1 Tax=Paramaledivibacter caminithermalis (strain DSM 15212 / CIP 107654 / DViRD3) TaxID=1121301 RepID=A0A1M6N2E6_PARC5|nr:DNA repair protein RadA [Paramaledivibacter caminithermalis]SHJ89871.1 DNA repair protein RadA/Sms [Paramaledivibacter caminithermalis DSM 15212]
MGKIKTKYVCQECGYISLKWMGKCPECNSWQSFVEEFVEKKRSSSEVVKAVSQKPVKLKNIELQIEDRFKTDNIELDRVLGGGIVKGSLVLVGGDPGIGKSTLLIQVASNIGNKGLKVLYVSGEESLKQIKMRADRLSIDNENLYIVSENNLQYISKYIEEINPNLLIIDSIQTVYNPDITSAPGSVSQVREGTATLMKLSKKLGIATFIVGHVTKTGSIAGPKVLEHMVDTVLYFEGEKHNIYRVLRAVKNRFGSTNEIGIFEMTNNGLEQVINPSHLFLAHRPKEASGSVVIAGIEGTRPVLIEIQALISPTSFGNPRRMATGIDYNRVVMLMAVLEKKIGLQLQGQDGYVNVVGGIQLSEPAVDLAIVCAIASSFRNKIIDHQTIIFGEVGLTGEVRAVNYPEKRITEAVKMGFKTCVIPKGNTNGLPAFKDIEIVGVDNVYEALDIVLGGRHSG